VQINEDQPAAITLAASDVDGDTLTFSVTQGPAHGTLSGTAPILTYTPNADFNGSDSFTFVANDGAAASNTATVSITVAPVNDAPVIANPGTRSNAEGDAVSIALVASDLDGDAPLAFSAMGLPPGLTLAEQTGMITGTLTMQAAGVYTPIVSVVDGHGASASATFTWTVADAATIDCSSAYPSVSEIWPVNHKPVAVGILGVTASGASAPTITVTAILQDEPTNTLGDGSTWIDGGGVGTSQAWVRAERVGTPKMPGNGRVYELLFRAAAGENATCAGRVLVTVPHDRSRGGAVDDGLRYESTVAGGASIRR
jgi:VCBS repeat-containing protein